MRSLFVSFATIAALTAAGTAYAAPNCTTAPKEKWMSQGDMQKRAISLGYKVKTFKVSGNCYEIYGWTKDGKKAEVYFNPVSGAVVKSKIQG